MTSNNDDVNKKYTATPDVTIDMFRSGIVPNVKGFPSYVDEISTNFCPYIDPSQLRGATTYTLVRSDTTSAEKAEELVFGCAYALCELLRFKRAELQTEHQTTLLCENIIFEFPHLDDTLGKELLAWPHFVLKCRYTKLGILFGKFWMGAMETAKDGRELPSPPCHFISIRDNVMTRDPRFFDEAKWLLTALESSSDNGQEVWSDILGCQSAQGAVKDFCAEHSRLNYARVNASLVDSSFYSQAKRLAANELNANKSTPVIRGD
jgi:hypothetical protein